MAEQLTPADFNNLFHRFKHEAFRLEVQPVYVLDYEQEAVDEFLRGEPRPVNELDFYADWLRQIKAATDEGRQILRVRVLTDPPTDYQRWEVWAGRWNIEAGEQIRYLDRDAAAKAGVPLTDDWWLFDRERLARMRFADDGTALGGYVVTDKKIVQQHCVWRDLAVRASSPAPECATA